MPAVRKQTVKKPSVPAANAPSTKATRARKKSSAQAAPAPALPAAPEISREQRFKMIEEAAYFRAQQHGFSGDPTAYWLAAEKEIEERLRRQGLRVKAS